MNIDEFLNGEKTKELSFEPNKILQLLLAKTIYNELQLKHSLLLLTEINAKLDGKEGNELLKESSLEMKVILDTINEEYRFALLEALTTISSH